MRRLLILLVLAVIIYIAHGISFGGYSSITIYGNEDPGACKLTLSVSSAPDLLTFTEVVTPGTGQSCTYQNLQFSAVARSDPPFGGNITLTQVNNTNTYTGSLSWSTLLAADGTYCGNLGDNGIGEDFWGCRFKYGTIYFQVAIFVNRTSGKFSTLWTDVIVPDYGATIVTSQSNQNILTPNKTFPHLVARLPNDYWSYSTEISNLSQPIFVTGTELLSNQLNLTTYFSNFELKAIFIKKPDNSYFIYRPTSQIFPFTAAKQGPNNTTNTGLTWGQVLPNLNVCPTTCQVTFYIGGLPTQAYILQTSGITTKPKTLLRT